MGSPFSSLWTAVFLTVILLVPTVYSGGRCSTMFGSAPALFARSSAAPSGAPSGFF